MEIPDVRIEHFHRKGFFFIPNPLGVENMCQLKKRQRQVEPEWEKNAWPPGFNRMACQFFLLGEVVLQLVEEPALVDLARRLLDCRHEVEIKLEPRWTLVWTPSCWHATGVKSAPGPRRAISWNYFPAGGRKRDVEALKHIFADEWESWTLERKDLWGLMN